MMVYITSKSVSLNIHLELQLNVQIIFTIHTIRNENPSNPKTINNAHFTDDIFKNKRKKKEKKETNSFD